MTLILTAFEIFGQALQAFIFTLLTASYIGGALDPEGPLMACPIER